MTSSMTSISYVIEVDITDYGCYINFNCIRRVGHIWLNLYLGYPFYTVEVDITSVICNVNLNYISDGSHISHHNSKTYSCKSKKSKNTSQ